MQLNFNNIQKKYLTVTLANGKIYMVATPKKKLLDKLINTKTIVDNNSNDEINTQTIDMLYTISAEIMSNNKTNTKVSSQELEELFDVEDIMLFFNSYMKFLENITNSKN